MSFANQGGKDILTFFEDQMNFLASPLPASAPAGVGPRFESPEQVEFKVKRGFK